MRHQLSRQDLLKSLAFFFTVILAFFFTSCRSTKTAKPTDLKCEYLTNPLGIDNTTLVIAGNYFSFPKYYILIKIDQP